MVKEYLHCPNYGDQRKVCPSIRASEGALANVDDTKSDWTAKFWKECLTKTPCLPLNVHITREIPAVGTTAEHAREVYDLLVEHTHKTRTTSNVDARHDTVFGGALY